MQGNVPPYFITINEDMRGDNQRDQGPFVITNSSKDNQSTFGISKPTAQMNSTIY
jgi:hypothetical protein